MTERKRCTECGEVLPLADFGRSARSKDGLRSHCKQCGRARSAAARVKRPKLRRNCSHCEAEFQHVNPKQIYCSPRCKGLAHEEQRSARAAQAPARRCACGAEVSTRVGKPVCPGCRKDPRSNAVERERSRTLRKYGLSVADWDAMLARQDGRCAICRTDRPGGRGEQWHIDHCHETGDVRGLLCHNCNVGLGNFGDDPGRLLAAMAYLGAQIHGPVGWWNRRGVA